MLLLSFVLLSGCIQCDKDGGNEHLSSQSNPNISNDPKKRKSAEQKIFLEKQKSIYTCNFSGSTLGSSFRQTKAKSTSSKIGQKGDSKANPKEKNFGKEGREEDTRENEVIIVGKYRLKRLGVGDSWQIGDDSSKAANAYRDYLKGCEENLIIPHNLTDELGNTKNIEVIGISAFSTCGQKGSGKARSIVLSKHIKVIKTWGLGSMDDVISFRIEEGSCLERIDYQGLTNLGYATTNRSGVLVLPSTLTSIAKNGIYDNNLFSTIYYCGSTHLSNYSEIVYNVDAPEIKVTSSYNHSTIFRDYEPKNDSSSIAEAEEKCKNFGYIPETSIPSHPFSDGGVKYLRPRVKFSIYSKFLASTYYYNNY